MTYYFTCIIVWKSDTGGATFSALTGKNLISGMPLFHVSIFQDVYTYSLYETIFSI